MLSFSFTGSNWSNQGDKDAEIPEKTQTSILIPVLVSGQQSLTSRDPQSGQHPAVPGQHVQWDDANSHPSLGTAPGGQPRPVWSWDQDPCASHNQTSANPFKFTFRGGINNHTCKL